MQRVVRSTLVGLSLIGLAACGDKVNLVQTDTTTHVVDQVTSVSVVPANIQLAINGTASLTATVTATPGITDRTVTWTSSAPAVASVGATTGVVTGLTAGTAAIIATSKADPKVTGAAAVTVTSAPLVTVTIATINTTIPGTGSVPAVLANFGTASPAGTSQLDVTLNVEGAISGAAVIVTCGAKADTVTQGTFPNAAPLVDGDASAASAPVTLSINTARIDPVTLLPRLNNGQCTIRGAVKTATGTQAITSNTALTLNNADVSIVSVTIAGTPGQGTDAASKVWFGGGPVTIAATPVFYSGRTAQQVSVGLAAAGGNAFTGGSAGIPASIPATATGATWSGTYTITQPAGAGSVYGVGATALVPTVVVVDNQGNTITAQQPFTVGTTPTNRFTPTTGTFALDEQKPPAGTFSVVNNTLQNTGANGYVSGNFRFVADSLAGYVGANPGGTACTPAGNQCNLDNGGSDRVTVVFQQRLGTSGAFTTFSNSSSLTETATSSSYQWRMITLDAVGNADTSANATFGVDKTPPGMTVTGPGPNTISKINQSQGTFSAVITDGLSGPGSQLVVQTRLSQDISSTTNLTASEGVVFLNGVQGATTAPCAIGRFNAALANAGTGALPSYERGGTIVGYCTPIIVATGVLIQSNDENRDGYYTTAITGTDAAGNKTPTTTTTTNNCPIGTGCAIADDPTLPTVISIDMPPTITGNATATFPASASDNMDIVGSFASINYPGAITLQYPGVSGPGVPFDNVLTRSATISPTVPNFIRNLQVAPQGTAVLAPNTATNNALSVTVGASDEALNAAAPTTVTFLPGVTLSGGATSTYTTGGTFSFGVDIQRNPVTVSNGPGTGATNPFSTTVTITAAGTTGTFANPWVGGAVQLWYSVGGNWFFGGNAGAGSARDDGVHRFWDYTVSFDPPAKAPDGTDLTVNGLVISIRGIGVNTNGDAVSSNIIPMTIANP